MKRISMSTLAGLLAVTGLSMACASRGMAGPLAPAALRFECAFEAPATAVGNNPEHVGRPHGTEPASVRDAGIGAPRELACRISEPEGVLPDSGRRTMVDTRRRLATRT